MKTYTFEVVIEEGYNEFWEKFSNSGSTGCDDVVRALKDILNDTGFDTAVKLIRFEDS